MGCSQNDGPLLVIGYNTAPRTYSGVPKWDPNFGNYPNLEVQRNQGQLAANSDLKRGALSCFQIILMLFRKTRFAAVAQHARR